MSTCHELYELRDITPQRKLTFKVFRGNRPGIFANKQFWKVCKLLNSTNPTVTVPTLVHGDTTAQTNVQKAEMLNSFYTTCFNKSQSPVESTDFCIPTSPDAFPSELLCNT